MAKVDAAWTAGDLAKAVCDELVAKGLLKEKPAFIRGDREKKFEQVFKAAKLDGASMTKMNGRGVEVAVRNATQGEGWVDDLQKVLKGMLDESAANDTTQVESEEMRQIREKLVEAARLENPDGAAPEAPGGRGRGRECFNCGQVGHESRDCPEPRQGGGRGGFRGGQDEEAYSSFGAKRGSDRACYNCGQPGHQSRDCPEPRQERDDGAYGSFGGRGGGGFGGDRNCYNCGQPGHQSRDCPEPRQERRYDGDRGGGGYGGGGDRGGYGGDRGGFADDRDRGGYGGERGGGGGGDWGRGDGGGSGW